MNTEMKKTVVYSTGDKILNIMKEQDMDIPELSLRCGVRRFVYGSFALMKKAMSFRWKKISLQSSL